MLDELTMRRYRAARAAGMGARSARELARYETGELPFELEIGRPASVERDGFTLTIALVHDPDGQPVGTFTDTWEPGAIANPAAQHETGTLRWFLPQSGTVAAHRAELARTMGRHAADCTARGYVREEMERARWNRQHGVIVTCYRAGVELGEASIWGVDSDDLERYAVLALAPDLISEAIGEARASLDRLCAAA